MLQELGKFNDNLSQCCVVADEGIYVISGQRRSLLSWRVCGSLNSVRLFWLCIISRQLTTTKVTRKLVGDLDGISGDDYNIQLREDATPFA